jgi:hypothetical protein
VLTTMPHVRPQPDTDPSQNVTAPALLRPSVCARLSFAAPVHGSVLDDITAEDDEAGYEEEPESLASGRWPHVFSGEAA